MNVTLTALIVLSLAIFRITRLLAYDQILAGLRSRFFSEYTLDGVTYLEPVGKLGELLSCHWCLGFWVSAVVGGLYIWSPEYTVTAALIPALAGFASLIETVVQRAQT